MNKLFKLRLSLDLTSSIMANTGFIMEVGEDGAGTIVVTGAGVIPTPK